MAATVGQLPDGTQAVFDSKGKVHMRDSAGNVFRVDPELVAQQSVTEGWKIAAPAEIEAVRMEEERGDQDLLTFGEAAASSALEVGLALPRAAHVLAVEGTAAALGAPAEKRKELASQSPFLLPSGREVVAEGVGLVAGEEAQADYEKAARERAIINPAASFTGQVVGSIAGSGGLIAPAGGVLQRGVMAAVEGYAQGVAAVDEDAYITNVPLTAQRVLAGGAIGAVLGGGASFGMDGLSAVLGRQSAKSVTSGLDALPPEQFAAEISRLRAAGEISVREARDLTRRYEVGLPLESDWMQNAATEHTLKAIGMSGAKLRKMARSPEGLEFNADKLARDIQEATLADGTPVFGATDKSPFWSRVSSTISGSEADSTASKLYRKLDEVNEELGAVRRQVDNFANSKPALRRDIADQTDTMFSEIEQQVMAPLRQRGPLVATRSNMIEAQLAHIKDQLGGQPTLSALEQARQDLAALVYPRGAGFQFPPAVAETRLELMAVERIMDRNIRAAQAKVLAAMPEPPGGPNYITELAAKVHSFQYAARAATESDWAGTLASGSQNAAYAIGGMTAVSGDPTVGIKLLAAKAGVEFVRENYDQVAAVLMHRLAKAFNKDVTKSVKHAVHGPEKVKLPKRLSKIPTTTGITFANRNESKRKAYLRRAQETTAFAADPEGANTKLARALTPVAGGAPKTTGMMAATMARAQLFLASKLPKGVVAISPLSPTKLRTEAGDDEIAAWAVYWEAVMNPRSVLRDLAKGTLLAEQVEALKAVYPELLADIQQQVLVEIAMRKDEIPYNRRLQLDILLELGGAGEPSLQPSFQNTLAAALATTEAEEAAASPPKRMPKAGGARNRHSTVSGQIESSLGA